MKIILHKIKDTKNGKIVEEQEAAIIEFDGENIYIKSWDRKLKEKLQEIFSIPFTTRKAISKHGFHGFVMEMVSPNTRDHFKEIAFLLRKGNFHVKLIE